MAHITPIELKKPALPMECTWLNAMCAEPFLCRLGGAGGPLLRGSWDLVTMYNWGCNPTCNSGNPDKAI